MSAIESPCGADCTECQKYSAHCMGCSKIEGKVWWVKYTGNDICDYYNCCINIKHLAHCDECSDFPCEIFYHGDPTKSDEENKAILEMQISRLKPLK